MQAPSNCPAVLRNWRRGFRAARRPTATNRCSTPCAARSANCVLRSACSWWRARAIRWRSARRCRAWPRLLSKCWPSAAVAEFQLAHGRVPGSELVILGLGRLGGGVLTHASDLDLVVLFTGDHSAESDGPSPTGSNRVLQPAVPAGDRGAERPDGRRRALRDRYAAASLGRAGTACREPGELRALPARTGLDLGAYGADPRPPGIRFIGGARAKLRPLSKTCSSLHAKRPG